MTAHTHADTLLSIRDTQLGDRLAITRSCEVFAWGSKHVLKLFTDGYDPDTIEQQARLAGLIHATGLPVPAVLTPMVRHVNTGRVGTIYERMDGGTLLEALARSPLGCGGHVRDFARLHRAVHEVAPPAGLMDQPTFLDRKLRSIDSWARDDRDGVLRVLELLPGGHALCHGDFSPRNVILRTQGIGIIDWADATVGNRLCDALRTWSTIVFNRYLSVRGRAVAWWIGRTYLRSYFDGVYYDRRQVEGWHIINAALRLLDLQEQAPRDRVLRHLRRRLPQYLAA